MVTALGPGKFYGSSLPRPRFYTDVKLNDHRVDPPLPVMGPLLSWAEEAHWSMGGLSFQRHRLQGRIEGNVDRLRAQREHEHEQDLQKSPKQRKKKSSKFSPTPRPDEEEGGGPVTKTPSPPPPPVAIKRRRVLGLLDDDEDAGPTKRGAVRKLGDDFDRVAKESGMDSVSGGESVAAVAPRTRSKRDAADLGGGGDEVKVNKKRKLVKGGRKIGAAVVAAAIRTRTSPRSMNRI